MERTCNSGLLNFAEHGAQRYRSAIVGDLADLTSVLKYSSPNNAGKRIHGIGQLRPFLAPNGSIGAIAASVLGNMSRPVRAILFDKTAETNWSLAWHQDRTVCVRRKIDTDGFGPWTTKAGMQHVTPPFDLLKRMVTLRVHIDDVPETNAPLLIAPASHLEGRVPVERINEVVHRCGVRACIAEAGDIWLYSTPILHASEAASNPTHRRVLQLDYSADNLPNGLEWLGV